MGVGVGVRGRHAWCDVHLVGRCRDLAIKAHGCKSMVVPPSAAAAVLTQGVALAARSLGCSAVICMPTNRRGRC